MENTQTSENTIGDKLPFLRKVPLDVSIAKLDSLDNTRNTTNSKGLHSKKRNSYMPPNDVNRTGNKMFGHNEPTSTMFMSPLMSPQRSGPTSPTMMSPANVRDFRRTVANQSVQNRARLDPGSITTFNMKEVFKNKEGLLPAMGISASASKLQLQEQISNLSNY